MKRSNLCANFGSKMETVLALGYLIELFYYFVHAAEKYNNMTQSVKADGLGESSLDDSLINLTGTILEFVCSLLFCELSYS